MQIDDDVVIHGVGKQHNARLKAVLDRFEEYGLTLNSVECEWGREEVMWFGMIFGGEGMSHDLD